MDCVERKVTKAENEHALIFPPGVGTYTSGHLPFSRHAILLLFYILRRELRARERVWKRGRVMQTLLGSLHLWCDPHLSVASLTIVSHWASVGPFLDNGAWHAFVEEG